MVCVLCVLAVYIILLLMSPPDTSTKQGCGGSVMFQDVLYTVKWELIDQHELDNNFIFELHIDLYTLTDIIL